MTVGYHRLAEASILVSISSLLLLVLTLPNIYDFAETEKDIVVERSARFRKSTDELWTTIIQLRENLSPSQISFFTRNRRADWLMGGGFCKGCFTLACPMGMPGQPGNPGPDGSPGDAGRPGKTGDDGFDIQLETEPEMPCVVCPAGPPGPRGAQGERGLSGTPGVNGPVGPDGSMGMDGPVGPEGELGISGENGPIGARGNQGDMAVAGIGVRGPIGPPGPIGMKGQPGPPGKPSKTPGLPGNPGTSGAIGQTGKQGTYGIEGSYGPPGDPGMPASYCPSDCGVQNILTEMFPAHSNSRLNQYSAPPGIQSTNSQTESKAYGIKTNKLTNFERKLRKKMIKRLLALRKYKQ